MRTPWSIQCRNEGHLQVCIKAQQAGQGEPGWHRTSMVGAAVAWGKGRSCPCRSLKAPTLGHR